MFLSRAVSSLAYYAGVGWYYFKLAIQRQIEYPLFLVSWFLFNFLQWFTGYYFLRVLATQFHDIAGWTFPELIFLYSLSLISHGLVVIFFIQTWGIGRMIIRGEFDQILLKPMDSFFLFMVRNVNFIGIADLIPGVIVFVYACHLLHFQFTVLSTTKVVCVILAGVLIRTSMFLLANSTAFWSTNRNRLTVFVLEMIQRTTMYPLTMFPYFMQVALTFVLPLAFISFYPAIELLGKGQGMVSYSLLGLALGVGFILMGYGLFNLGMRKYESVGN